MSNLDCVAASGEFTENITANMAAARWLLHRYAGCKRAAGAVTLRVPPTAVSDGYRMYTIPLELGSLPAITAARGARVPQEVSAGWRGVVGRKR
jgi:hypothetical protein